MSKENGIPDKFEPIKSVSQLEIEVKQELRKIIVDVQLLKNAITKIWKQIYKLEEPVQEKDKELPEGFKQLKTGKCPFRKTIHKIHTKEDGIGESFRETIQEEEIFVDCIGFGCMAFTYEKTDNIESIGCKRMDK